MQGFVQNSIEEHLKLLQNNEIKMWMDFKNLHQDNAMEALNCLNGLLKKYQICKNRIIVESGDSNSLKIFKENGYYVSCYLPYLKLEEMSVEKIAQEKNRIFEIARSGNISAVSFPAYMYDFIKSMNLDIDLLTWDSGGETGRNLWYKTYFDSDARKMIDDN